MQVFIDSFITIIKIHKQIKHLSISFILLLFTLVSFASHYSDSLIYELNRAIDEYGNYDNNKLREIAQLKHSLNDPANSDLNKQYQVNLKLYEDYKYYNYDSAFNYTKKLRSYAAHKQDVSLLADARIKQVFILLSAGLFKETFDSLNVLSIAGVADDVKANYYSLKARCYYDLADFDDDQFHTASYYSKANECMDSALRLYPVNTFEFLYFSGLLHLKKGQTDSALSNLRLLLSSRNLSYHEIALTTSMMGGIFSIKKNNEQARNFLIQASIADIKSSTKETSALLSVANIIFKEGDIKDAGLYIEKANADAAFYKARLRKVQIAAILPLIKEQMINTIEIQKKKLIISLILLTLLVLLLAAFAVIVRNQVRKLRVARLSLLEANLKQQAINQELEKAYALKEEYNAQMQESNRQLSEANKIKEEYLGYYFSIDTEFMARMEKLVNTIEKKLVDRKWDEVKLMLKTINFRKEKEELLRNFDKTFIKLFPDFVDQFNMLFNPEDRFILKKEQLLNTELRIFALIRMGITDNEKIAEILNYSINTIYSYKTKMRNKAIIPKEDFDKKITEITTIHYRGMEQ